jgi:CDP-paratose 2-epimerase
MHLLVTGCNGLIGSEAALYFDRLGHTVTGIDNNMRQFFFGPPGDTRWNLARLQAQTERFKHVHLDIRDRESLFALFRQNPFDVVIHCAAQPSHDKAREIPLIDFDVNAGGTINLLEAMRQFTPEAVFIHMSTNKVYGDAPNELPLVELETRYDYADPKDYEGISETCRVDRCLHSLFGASKAAADLIAQEYGRYFGMKVGVFRGGCLTGPSHSGVELHGFLSYLIKVAVSGEVYTIFGYKGKQVRDQIHSYDVIRAFESFINHPRQGEVYNLGGGRANSASVLESIDLVERLAGKKLNWRYVEQNRIGDHICYISDLSKLRAHFPEWSITRSLPDICDEILASQVGVVKEAPSR